MLVFIPSSLRLSVLLPIIALDVFYLKKRMLSSCGTDSQGKAMKGALSRAPHVQPKTSGLQNVNFFFKQNLFPQSQTVWLQQCSLSRPFDFAALALSLVFVFVDEFISRKFRVGRGRHWETFCGLSLTILSLCIIIRKN